MKRFSAKTVEDALKSASTELNLPIEELLYEVEEEKKGLFTKKAVIAVYDTADVIEYAQNYIKAVIKDGLGIEVSLKAFFRNGLIKILHSK